ncbi:hypothetical protein GCM10022392_18080 [Mucilaginibacter panaciglaebae]|uniref:TonB C-terminal domain-containing protein n=2 Tax=Mucilaginibacter panaciglaebae TaxID=502331 RepID=A0ABP7WSM0_9SPHI
MLQNVRAQDSAKSDTLKYYFDINDIETSKEIADHSIFILPKSEKDGGLYPIIGYYKGGNVSLTAFLKTPALSNRFEGLATSYYPNGNKKRIVTYQDGEIIGEFTDFFSNGKRSRVSFFDKNEDGERQSNVTEFYMNGGFKEIYRYNAKTRKGISTKYFPNGNIYLIRDLFYAVANNYIECRDSTGTVLAKHGNGKLIVYTNDFKTAIKQIKLKDGEISGNWQPIVDSTAEARFDKTGPAEKLAPNMPYFNNADAALERTIVYRGARFNFVNFVEDNFEYPKEDLKNKIEGEVDLTMIVEKNGALTHIKIAHTISKALADEVTRVVQLSAPWGAGRSADGTPVRIQTSIGFKFVFKADTRGKMVPNVIVYVDSDISPVLVDSLYNRSDSTFFVGNVDIKPQFPGGIAEMRKFLSVSLRYPIEDIQQHREGKVYVQFVIEKDGHASNIHAISGPSETMKEAAEKVIKQFAGWIPGSINNKPVRVVFTLPINFKLTGTDTLVQVKVEHMPEFPGGLQAFVDFLGKNLHYPAAARDRGLSGRVYATFVVEKDGTLTDFKVFRSPGRILENEAIRVLKKSPKWQPGTQDGKPVRVSFTVPINFNLEEDAAGIMNPYHHDVVFEQALNN